MKNLTIKTIIYSIFLCTLFFQPLQAQENEDHELLSRFDGAEVHREQSANFDEVKLPAGPVVNGEPESLLELKGRISWIAYRTPEERSALEIARNYETAFADGDFDILYSCAGRECGEFYTYLRESESVFPNRIAVSAVNHNHGNSRVYVVKNETTDLVSHFLLYIVPHPRGRQGVVLQLSVDGEPMDTGLVEAGVRNADELQQALDNEGRAIVEGIFFDYDSSEILSESAEALEQMALLMNNESGINVLIVGHTDNQGPFDYNLGLSEQRAEAVRQALIDDYGITGSRMTAFGVSFAAPVASNSSEDGQAKNRRVELVLQ